MFKSSTMRIKCVAAKSNKKCLIHKNFQKDKLIDGRNHFHYVRRTKDKNYRIYIQAKTGKYLYFR